MLDEMLSRLAIDYIYERAKSFAESDFANFVRHDIATEAKKQLIFLPHDLTVKASVGQSRWAAVPWLGFFDPLVTSSATKGHYVVYLVNAHTEEITLSLNQGTTAIYNEFGEKKGREILKRRAIDMAERIPEFSSIFETAPIDLGSQESLPLGYCAGHSMGRTYDAHKIPKERFYSDLEQLLAAYATLIDRGGTTPSDTMYEEASSDDVEETRRYVLSRRIERAPNVRPKVLERRQPICEACGLDPALHLGYRGQLKNVPLDVHHAKPIKELHEGESRRYRIPEDFFVLCPTCHRLIHKQNDQSDLDELKSRLNYTILVKQKAR